MTTEQTERERRVICVLGASFDTGNLGVNALAESTIKIVLHRWPDAEIVLLGNGYQPAQLSLPIGGREVTLRTLPVRFSRNLLLPYHFLRFVWCGAAARLLPWPAARRRIFRRNPCCRTLHEAALAVDITGGDSFSDIYGMRRFLLGFLRKWLVLFYRKKLIMLPQTYGPFRRKIARRMARYILSRAEVVYSRDREGVEHVKGLLAERTHDRVRFCPDVGFVLDARPPGEPALRPDADLRAHGSVVVGLNVSGLLYHGGYTQNNMFGLKTDYRRFVREVAELLLQQDGVVLLLVPHVFPRAEARVESDPIACEEVFTALQDQYHGRVFLAAGRYNHNEIKHVIGQCDFFLGSRMHACIAALSQRIPAVGLAYSGKFRGVFGTAGVDHCVVDLLARDSQSALGAVQELFRDREKIRGRLEESIPVLQEQILSLWDNGSSSVKDGRA